MSLPQGFSRVDDAVLTTTNAPEVFYDGLGALNTGAMCTTTDAPVFFPNGLPTIALGYVCITTSPTLPVFYSNGMKFDATGRLVVTETAGTPTFSVAGFLFDANGNLVISPDIDYATTWPFAAYADANDGALVGPWNDLTRTGLGTRIGPTGIVEYGPHNLLLNSATLSTQNVTTAAGQYTLKFGGAGTVTLSGTGSGTLSAGTNTFTATAGTLTLTVSGSVTTAQLNVGAVATDYVATTGTARYLPRIDYDPVTLASRGLLIEGQGTNEFATTYDLTTASWSRFNVTAASGVADSAVLGATSTRLTLGVGTAFKAVRDTASAGARIASFFVKPESGVRYVQILADTNVQVFANFDLQTATKGSAGTAIGGYNIAALSSGWFVIDAHWTATNPDNCYLAVVDSASAVYSSNTSAVGSLLIQADNLIAGATVRTSHIPNPGTGTAVRVADWTGPGVALTGAALAAAFPSGVTGPFTGVFKYRKSYSTATDETLLALSAGSSAGGTNLFAVQTNGTQAKLTTSAGDGTATGTLVHDGSTVNRIAYSVDPASGKMSISVNGAAAVETTGIAYTGAGVTSLIPGSQTTGGLEPVTQMEISEWDNKRTTYITGSALQALSA